VRLRGSENKGWNQGCVGIAERTQEVPERYVIHVVKKGSWIGNQKLNVEFAGTLDVKTNRPEDLRIAKIADLQSLVRYGTRK
jgi:hypothetical protein